jgi:hypothetical protein
MPTPQRVTLNSCLQELQRANKVHLQDAIDATIEAARPFATKCVYLAAWNADYRLHCGKAGKNPERDLCNGGGCVSCGIEGCLYTRDHKAGTEFTEDEALYVTLELCKRCSYKLREQGPIETACEECGWVHELRKPRQVLDNMLALTKMLLDDSPLTECGKMFLGKALKMFGVSQDPKLHDQLIKTNFVDFDGDIDELDSEWDFLECVHGLVGDPDPDAAVLLLLASHKRVCPLSFKDTTKDDPSAKRARKMV